MSKTQSWEIGQVVKVGFMTLTVISMKNGDYLLKSAKGVYYSFIAYRGISKLDDYGSF